jgi:hypothetical protein
MIAAGEIRFVIEIADLDIPFNILSLPDPDTTADIVERELGGLGVYSILEMADEVSYRRHNGCNILRVVLHNKPGTMREKGRCGLSQPSHDEPGGRKACRKRIFVCRADSRTERRYILKLQYLNNALFDPSKVTVVSESSKELFGFIARQYENRP